MSRPEAPEPIVKIRKKSGAIPLPQYESEGAAGLDIRAFLPADLTIPSLGRARIPTGLFLEIPPGYEAQVRPRSGLAARQGLTVLNTPGTIDSDYRGELEIILINLGAEAFIVRSGERIAQLVIAPVSRARIAEVQALSDSKRGDGGFGSTGI
ncbi:MAG: dUTP diphosphatase [Treponema sp.]|jgi:dUTP pyrophosphatase|nr:dUTP diphosphatase [Treponema sp.]